MTPEIRRCQNKGKSKYCMGDFEITPDDFTFYEKIKVPPPTFCSTCRLISRYAFRNNLNLYKRACDLCKKDIISMYPSDSSFPVFCSPCFFSDNWDPTSYGIEYDFSDNFFDQFKKLSDVTPRINLIGTNKVNSDFSNHVTDVKNVYLSFSVGASEDCFFMGPQCVRDKNCSSCSMTRDSEWCYMLVDCEHCYNVGFSQNSLNCVDSLFLYDCRNCNDCLGCSNLRNKSYCIFNTQYSKDEYFKIKESYRLDTFLGLSQFKEKYKDFTQESIKKYATFNNTQNCSGDFIYNSKNCKNCFTVVDSEDTTYGFISNGSKDCMDVCHTYPNAELVYNSMSAIYSSRIFFSSFMYSNCLNAWYSDNCYSLKDSFGCISLRNKEYCILNKQYTKEEYISMIEKIKKHMVDMPYRNKIGIIYKFGDFFPIDISPFPYNDSAAQEYFPLTQAEVHNVAFSWNNSSKNTYTPSFYFNENQDTTILEYPNICNEIIECTHKNDCNHNCLGGFKILSDELLIYKKLKIMIPDLCHNCRYHERLNIKNPLQLWSRTCMNLNSPIYNGPCQNTFETSYAPDRPEKVYCEDCYKREVL